MRTFSLENERVLGRKNDVKIVKDVLFFYLLIKL